VFGVFLPLSGAVVNVVWGLGFAAWMGYALDPLVLVVPMLITARAISHSVQFVERFYEEYEELGDKEQACIRSMAELLLPGTMAILTDCVGLLTISLATIPLIHELGILCAFWAASIAVTEMLLNRLLILYLPPPRERTRHVPPTMTRLLGAAARLVHSRVGATAVVGGFAVTAVLGLALARDVEVGENRPGTPLLYPGSEYNVAAREIGRRFGGTDDLLVVAHSDLTGRVYATDSLALIEALQAVLGADPAAGGSLSLVDLLKQTNRIFHHKDPRWAMRMQTPVEVLGIQYLIETSVPAPGVLDPYRALDQRSLAVRVFYGDHQATTVAGAVERLGRFVENERLDGSLAVRLRAGEPGALRRALGWLAPILPPPAPRLEVSVPDPDGGGSSRRMLATSGPIRERAEDGTRVVERWEETFGGAVAEVRHAGGFAPYELWVREAGAEFEPRWSGVWLRDGVELRHAAGTIGVLAAANQEIEASHRLGLVVAFAATFLIIVASYRSLLVGVLLIASLGVAAVAALATQALAGIAINVNTLPVQAIGIGIGVDYAIYIVDRVRAEARRGFALPDAVARAVRTTGLAIGFTASTLLVGIVFWIPISSLRFSAEMSLLLCILMAVNALGAVLLVPSLIRLLPPSLARRL
jgi:predicted RND superfamily exporter protein